MFAKQLLRLISDKLAFCDNKYKKHYLSLEKVQNMYYIQNL
ncbi:MAG: hypothetical protein Q8830_01680 [Candidatus Phytoplasma australasiaticum]|nr:hypothetical protein [Candidatus Phytoplasma australasiaticum]